MRPEIIRKYAAPVPRYTSYPTAPHFSPAVNAELQGRWLGALPAGSRLSLYVHFPFCHQLCWYCGCNTKATQRYEPVAGYLPALEREIATVGSLVPARHDVIEVHWGGGSPNILSDPDIERVGAALKRAFRFAPEVEFAVEVDPRHATDAQAEAFHKAGVTRVSIGVQDFDPAVQQAINRLQPFERTRDTVQYFRHRGITSINLDLIYGLPHQTRDSIAATFAKVVALDPDRIALFGYAHLPERLTHQRLIPNAALPDSIERFAQAGLLARLLQEAGYVRVGLDHFAKPTDPLATRTIRRNFQGYTTDAADALVGLGASAISQLPQGYVQNAVPTGDYQRRALAGELAGVRGIELDEDDRMRALTIERLMCGLEFPGEELRSRFGERAAPLIDEARALVANDSDGLIEARAGGFVVTETGRPFVRTIAARFDAYLAKGVARHSAGV